MNTINKTIARWSANIAESGIAGVLVLLGLLVFLFGIGVAGLSISDSMSRSVPSSNVISVTGKGERLVVPNIAVITYDVSKEAATVEEAQQYVNRTANDILTYLKKTNIEDRDIKTVNYSIMPQYDYPSVPCYSSSCSNKRTFSGYLVTNSVEVRIRAIEKAGGILSELGKRGVTNLSGLSFIVENEDAVRAEARRDAIVDAKAKAEILAKDLGVRIVRITSFSESGGGYYPMPMYAKGISPAAMGAGDAAVSAEVAAGENKITTHVTISYEVK